MPDRPVIALFDVDNTLMRGASLYYFGRAAYRHKIIGMRDIAVFAWQQARFLAVGENKKHIEYAEERGLALLSGHTVQQLEQIADEVVDREIMPRLWPETVTLAREHLEQGHLVYLITATPRIVAEAIASRLGFTGALGTEVEAVDGIYTGELIGHVLHGERKREALHELATRLDANLEDSWAYSDSRHDVPLLDTVGHRMAINPDKPLAQHAEAHGWPVLTLDKQSIKDARRRIREEAKRAKQPPPPADVAKEQAREAALRAQQDD